MSKSLQTKQGKVITKSGNKTIKVEYENRKPDLKYKKVIKNTSYFLVHDEKNKAKIGDFVTFVSCRPLSSKKTWRLIDIYKERK